MFPTLLANVGVPMIFLMLSMMMVLLIPVIGIEYLVAWRMVPEESWGRKLGGIAYANLVSTFVGWPVAWFLLLLFNLLVLGGRAYGLDSPLQAFVTVVLQATWLVPYEEEFYWMIPTAASVLLVPFFFASVYLERWLLYPVWKKTPWKTLCRFSWRSHWASYLFLLAAYWILLGTWPF
ncbi:MAG: hypothetical protein Q4D98_01700 [Planctomycetia bacterium]|nr:hypothetical protein [Planctomycetia bacterium]